MTLIVSKRGAKSIPISAGVNFSRGFFFAFMMLGKDAYLGSENKGSCKGTAHITVCGYHVPFNLGAPDQLASSRMPSRALTLDPW